MQNLTRGDVEGGVRGQAEHRGKAVRLLRAQPWARAEVLPLLDVTELEHTELGVEQQRKRGVEEDDGTPGW